MGLLAAAAVVVAGVAIGQGLPQRSSNDSEAGSASGGDMATSQEQGPADGSDGGGSDAGSGSAELAPDSMKSTAPRDGVPTLSSFAAGLDEELLDLRSTDTSRNAEPGSPGTLVGCGLRGIGPGRRIVAQVDGRLGLVVLRRPDGAVQRADLYVCGDPAPVRTITLPAP